MRLTASSAIRSSTPSTGASITVDTAARSSAQGTLAHYLSCSDFSLSGKDLGENEKSIRMCEACIQKCWKYIAKHDDNYIEHRKSGDLETVKELPSNIEEIQQQSRSTSHTE